jgi:hypothetical protein
MATAHRHPSKLQWRWRGRWRAGKPARVPGHDWILFVEHVERGVPYTVLAGWTGASASFVRERCIRVSLVLERLERAAQDAA